MNVIVKLLIILLFDTVILLVIWIYCIAPRIINRPSFAKLKKYDYAHRGLHNENVPENSMAAFMLAAQNGYGMEFDLQLTNDGIVVVHHDNSLKRMCGDDRLISETDYIDLQNICLNETDEKIPLFFDVLQNVNGKTPLIIELKDYGRPDELCEKTWEILESYTGDYCVESFNPIVVKWFRNHHSEVIRGQLMMHYKKGKNVLTAISAFLATNLFSNILTRPDFEAYNYISRQNLSLRLAKKLFKMQEVSWTIKNHETYNQCKKDGCICIFEGINAKEEQ